MRRDARSAAACYDLGMSELRHVLDVAALHALLQREFPQAAGFGEIVSVGGGELVLRLRDGADDRHLRPGGTLSGPTLFTMADLSFYALVLSLIGPVPLAVTTSLNLSFLRKPAPGELTARARMLKLGSRLAVGDCVIESPGLEGPVAHAQVTYSIPPR